MKCFYHASEDAVGTCNNNCGKHLCQECASIAESVICRDCLKKIYATAKQEASGTRIKSFLAIAWNAVFFLFGIYQALQYANNPNVSTWGVLAVWWGFSGLPWILCSGVLKKDTSVQAQVERAISNQLDPVGISLFTWILGAFFKLALGFILGAIASPFILAYSIFTFSAQSKVIQEMDANMVALEQLG